MRKHCYGWYAKISRAARGLRGLFDIQAEQPGHGADRDFAFIAIMDDHGPDKVTGAKNVLG